MRRARHLYSFSAVGRPSRGFSQNTPTDSLLYMYIHRQYIHTSVKRYREAMSGSPFHRTHSARPWAVKYPTKHSPLRDVYMLAYLNKIEQEDARVAILSSYKAKPDLFNRNYIVFRPPFVAMIMTIAVEPRWKWWILIAASLIWFMSSPCTSLPQANPARRDFKVVGTDIIYYYPLKYSC